LEIFLNAAEYAAVPDYHFTITGESACRDQQGNCSGQCMPFTANEFLDVFAAYNQGVWPFAAVLWLLTMLVGVAVIAGVSMPAPLPRLLLAGQWVWAGVVYHAWFFTAINPAAWLFASLFVAQGVLFIAFETPAYQAVDGAGSTRRVASTLLIVYSLIYPVVVWADGFTYPRMPTFGVPCSTVILTIGVLLATAPPSVLLSVIPVGWSVLAGSAAWLFGVHADLVLPAAGGVLVIDLILRRSHVMKKLSFGSVFIVVVAMLILVPASPALAQAAQHDHEQQAQKSGMKMGEMKMDPKMMEEMAARNRANTERMTALMAQVRSTRGDAKVAAMADVIGVLLEERTAMGEHCAAMMKMMTK
jgi:hypothetical protein